MTQEEKRLLLTDLCERYPHNVVVNVIDHFDETYSQAGEILDIKKTNMDCNGTPFLFKVANVHVLVDITEVKPYLRSLSSMTEEERKHFESMCCWGKWESGPIITLKAADWFNEHHFDYRGLIEKGLAIEVTPENNPYKE